MSKMATELVDVLRALSAHYAAVDSHSRDGILQPRPGDGTELAMAA